MAMSNTRRVPPTPPTIAQFIVEKMGKAKNRVGDSGQGIDFSKVELSFQDDFMRITGIFFPNEESKKLFYSEMNKMLDTL